ncbi:hypothetical protein BV898_03186 [Hypsibius exemplaris]|uniref:Uncharacterized protein n=1 Tax=Hypsibius exemplaris TaxID=2072580 RepID=A0A1W0X592_HYPEX|nr:hypothetical protein BV898_03186 [Hypsibius exemplaris]
MSVQWTCYFRCTTHRQMSPEQWVSHTRIHLRKPEGDKILEHHFRTYCMYLTVAQREGAVHRVSEQDVADLIERLRPLIWRGDLPIRTATSTDSVIAAAPTGLHAGVHPALLPEASSPPRPRLEPVVASSPSPEMGQLAGVCVAAADSTTAGGSNSPPPNLSSSACWIRDHTSPITPKPEPAPEIYQDAAASTFASVPSITLAVPIAPLNPRFSPGSFLREASTSSSSFFTEASSSPPSLFGSSSEETQTERKEPKSNSVSVTIGTQHDSNRISVVKQISHGESPPKSDGSVASDRVRTLREIPLLGDEKEPAKESQILLPSESEPKNNIQLEETADVTVDSLGITGWQLVQADLAASDDDTDSEKDANPVVSLAVVEGNKDTVAHWDHDYYSGALKALVVPAAVPVTDVEPLVAAEGDDSSRSFTVASPPNVFPDLTISEPPSATVPAASASNIDTMEVDDDVDANDDLISFSLSDESDDPDQAGPLNRSVTPDGSSDEDEDAFVERVLRHNAYVSREKVLEDMAGFEREPPPHLDKFLRLSQGHCPDISMPGGRFLDLEVVPEIGDPDSTLFCASFSQELLGHYYTNFGGKFHCSICKEIIASEEAARRHVARELVASMGQSCGPPEAPRDRAAIVMSVAGPSTSVSNVSQEVSHDAPSDGENDGEEFRHYVGPTATADGYEYFRIVTASRARKTLKGGKRGRSGLSKFQQWERMSAQQRARWEQDALTRMNLRQSIAKEWNLGDYANLSSSDTHKVGRELAVRFLALKEREKRAIKQERKVHTPSRRAVKREAVKSSAEEVDGSEIDDKRGVLESVGRRSRRTGSTSASAPVKKRLSRGGVKDEELLLDLGLVVGVDELVGMSLEEYRAFVRDQEKELTLSKGDLKLVEAIRARGKHRIYYRAQVEKKAERHLLEAPSAVEARRAKLRDEVVREMYFEEYGDLSFESQRRVWVEVKRREETAVVGSSSEAGPSRISPQKKRTSKLMTLSESNSAASDDDDDKRGVRRGRRTISISTDGELTGNDHRAGLEYFKQSFHIYQKATNAMSLSTKLTWARVWQSLPLALKDQWQEKTILRAKLRAEVLEDWKFARDAELSSSENRSLANEVAKRMVAVDGISGRELLITCFNQLPETDANSAFCSKDRETRKTKPNSDSTGSTRPRAKRNWATDRSTGYYFFRDVVMAKAARVGKECQLLTGPMVNTDPSGIPSQNEPPAIQWQNLPLADRETWQKQADLRNLLRDEVTSKISDIVEYKTAKDSMKCKIMNIVKERMIAANAGLQLPPLMMEYLTKNRLGKRVTAGSSSSSGGKMMRKLKAQKKMAAKKKMDMFVKTTLRAQGKTVGDREADTAARHTWRTMSLAEQNKWRKNHSDGRPTISKKMKKKKA